MGRTSISDTDAAKNYVFHFDTPMEPLVFDELALSGWLLHREGKPINGIRAIVKRKFARRKIVRARRKRRRPDVEAAFPHLPDAKISGFLFELRLPLGRNHLTFQVFDHEHIWRTFHTATIFAAPFFIIAQLGFPNVRRFLVSCLKHSYSHKNSSLSRVDGAKRFVFWPQTSAPVRTKHVDLFGTTKSNLFILEIGELIAAGFRELGCTAQLHLDQPPAEDPPEEKLQIVVTPHEYHNLYLSEQLCQKSARSLTSSVLLLCTEQPETGWFQSNLQWAGYARGVADINALGVLAYRARGFRSHHLHLGYHPMLAAPRKKPQAERKYDLTFLGSLTPRREKFLARHADFFSQHQCHLRLVPLGFAKTKITRSYLSAAERNELLSDTRILLNLHYSEQKYFEWHRILVGLANGCCIISETCQGYGALVPGRHFIMVEPDELIGCCEYYLHHPEECAKIAEAGLEFVQTQLRQAQACAAFLHDIEGNDRDAANSSLFPLAADASPAPLPRDLRRIFFRQKARSLRSALASDFRNLLGKSAPAAASDIAPPSTQTLAKHRAVAIEKREAFRVRLAEQEERRARGEAVWQLHDNAAYVRPSAPALSVVITLFNYAHFIQQCVASITRAAEQLREPLEIVIVNDASTDRSQAQALQCQAESALPIRIVDKQFNTGLADARNVGVRIARAPFIFMMDADNLIFPNALRELLDAISRNQHAAAYSLLCRFRSTPAHRVGLLSCYDWDPQILVQDPYIDAMAMFRRDALLQLGGYNNQLSQIGWFGWEDYDMWLRFAQKNYRVGFVPNILCLYRHHQTSMLNVTNLFELDLVWHFKQRFEDLINRFEPRATLFGVDREKIVQAGRALAGSSRLPQISVPTRK